MIPAEMQAWRAGLAVWCSLWSQTQAARMSHKPGAGCTCKIVHEAAPTVPHLKCTLELGHGEPRLCSHRARDPQLSTSKDSLSLHTHTSL